MVSDFRPDKTRAASLFTKYLLQSQQVQWKSSPLWKNVSGMAEW